MGLVLDIIGSVCLVNSLVWNCFPFTEVVVPFTDVGYCYLLLPR